MSPKKRPRAYSYVRFSTPEQQVTDRSCRGLCHAPQPDADTELNLQESGVSAFHGKNAETGALGYFQRAGDVHVAEGRLKCAGTECTARRRRRSKPATSTPMDGVLQMSQSKEPIRREYPCAVTGTQVIQTGVRVRLHGGPGPFPLSIADAWTKCNGMPACGQVFRNPGCLCL